MAAFLPIPAKRKAAEESAVAATNLRTIRLTSGVA